MFPAMKRVLGIGVKRLFLGGLLLGWAACSSLAQTPEISADATNSVVVATDESASPVDNPVTAASDWVNRLASPAWVERLAEYLPFLEYQWLGNALWKYLASLIYIFLAFFTAKLVDFLTRVWLKRWAEKTQTRFDDLLLELLCGPVKVVCFVILLHVGLRVFNWPGAVEEFLSKALTIIVAASLTYMLIKFVDLAVGYWRKRVVSDEEKTFDDQLGAIIRKSLKVFVVGGHVGDPGQHRGENHRRAGVAGIGGLAVALAAQDTLANMFGAIAVFLTNRSASATAWCWTKWTARWSIGLRSTRVRSLDGFLVTIPNKTIANATIINISARPTIQTVMNIGITYDTSTEQVKRALKIIEDDKGHPGSSNCLISFNKFEDSALNILVIHCALDQLRRVFERHAGNESRLERAFRCGGHWLRLPDADALRQAGFGLARPGRRLRPARGHLKNSRRRPITTINPPNTRRRAPEDCSLSHVPRNPPPMARGASASAGPQSMRPKA